ncbi:MAG: phosphotransferase family protein [Phycisphaerales bacterium]
MMRERDDQLSLVRNVVVELRNSTPPCVHVVQIGHERGMTGNIYRATVESDRSSVIVKCPDCGIHAERAWREVAFYQEIGSSEWQSWPVPTLLAVHPYRNDHVDSFMLVLEDVRGCDGDVLTACTESEADEVCGVMVRAHKAWLESSRLAAFSWLPRWGSGTEGAGDPHARRIARLVRRIDPFLHNFEHWCMPGLADVIRALPERLPEDLTHTAALPPTLIHGDLHPENLIFATGNDSAHRVVVIDWQSVSAGPPVYDAARFLADAAPGERSGSVIALVLAHYKDAGLFEHVNAEQLRIMLRVCLAGFVSGYGGRDADTPLSRESSIIRHALSAEGMAGVLAAAGAC